MRRLSLGSPVGTDQQAMNGWFKQALAEIERASAEDIQTMLVDYSVTGTLTELRTVDAGTATLAELRNFVCTLVSDIRKGGGKKSYGS